MKQDIFFHLTRRIIGTILGVALLISLRPSPAVPTAQADLGTEFVFVGTEVNGTFSVAWGDWDNDGDLDLAVGNWNGVNQVYENNGETLKLDPSNGFGWQSTGDTKNTWDVAWGDWDGDGDLDLAVANVGQANQVYENDGGMLKLDPDNGFGWESSDAKDTYSLAWGDWDGDGDLDLAVGNGEYSANSQVNQVYENGGNGSLTLAWESTGDNKFTRSVAWGDWDGDGDLDLAVGNQGQVNQVYKNNGGESLSLAWESIGDEKGTQSVAWGDWDGDNDLDLAVGNSGIDGVNQVYENDGTESLSLVWESTGDQQTTYSVAWGDWDGDGDLDLAVGNECCGPSNENNQINAVDGNIIQPLSDDGGYIQIYENDGNGTLSLIWESPGAQKDSYSVAWGDWDGDGDLDLAVGNTGVNRVWLNDSEMLQLNSDNGFGWESGADNNSDVAWGDWDGDDDLDLAVGKRVYENDGMTLKLDPNNGFGWDGGEGGGSIAWGDWDGDGDLDLAVGNWNGVNEVYENDGETLKLDPSNGFGWQSTGDTKTKDVAWGDWDGDGDLDLAVGNCCNQANQIYENDEGMLKLDPDNGFGWESNDTKDTLSIAWGDWDGDGDLDLAVGNGLYSSSNQVNQVYENNGNGSLVLAWESPSEHKETHSIAWGDWDGDGDLDLAMGTDGDNEFTQVYENDAGTLKLDLNNGFGWESTGDAKDSYSVAWGDWDGDGDLDLAVGNPLDVNQVYENDEGTLNLNPANGLGWVSSDMKHTGSVAWGDWDNDGDLDLAVGNYFNTADQVYENLQQGGARLGNNPPTITIHRPGVTDDAPFFSSPQIITQVTDVSIPYTLFDLERDPVRRIIPEFSSNGGGQWFLATPGSGGDGLTNLAASPTGTSHAFIWNAEADQIIQDDDLVFRLRVQPSVGPIQWSASDAKSPPFRIAAPQFVKVVDENNLPVENAQIHHNGNLVGQTNQRGLFNPGPLQTGDELAAMSLQHEEPATRGEHDGWAYRTYITNIGVDAVGNTKPFSVTQMTGEQRLVVHPKQTLILFNLLVSIEWDATQAYVDDVRAAIESAADFLYDVSDGQMTFGQVAIYDKAEHWTEADIQITTKNIVHPHAFIGGLTDETTTNIIRVGRFWDGNTASQGNWSEPDGYHTLVHEFGHYALGLYDEYFGYGEENGELVGQKEAFCTGPENRTGGSDASIMDFHYTTSELADVGRWTDWCQTTAQQQLNGEADWQTLVRLYRDSPDQNRWQLVTPDNRDGVGEGQSVPGPQTLPAVLPFPILTTTNRGEDPTPFTLQVCYNGTPYQDGTWVTLTKTEGTAMDQGMTDSSISYIDILGATGSDSLQVVSFDGALSARRQVDQVLAFGYLELNPVSSSALAGQSVTTGPYLRLWPTTSNGDLDGLRMVVTRTLPNDTLNYALAGPDHLGLAGVDIPYDANEGQHQVKATFVPSALAGYAKVQGGHAGQFIAMNVDYRLQQVTPISDTDLFSNDGNFKLHVDAGTSSLDTLHFLIASPWGLPGPLPSGLAIAGEAYEITASHNVTGLDKPAVLTLRYDTEAGDTFDVDSLTIYRWDFSTATWLPPDEDNQVMNTERQQVSATITDLGVYALLGVPTGPNNLSDQNSVNPCGGPNPGSHPIYLPFIQK